MQKIRVGEGCSPRGHPRIHAHFITNVVAGCIFLGPVLQAHAAQPTVSLIDVMVVYTPSALSGAGAVGAIQAQIRSAVVEANTTFQNSGVNARLRLVHQQEIAYADSGSLATDLARLSNPNDGYLDAVQALREQYAADLVCLVTEAGDGRGFVGLRGPSAENAFSVIRRSYLTGSYYFPVALSFNFGCQLDRDHADTLGAFPFAYGYSFATNGIGICTAEAFTGQRLPIFSNPEILVGGVPAGISAGAPNAADNARVLNTTAPLVAAFRGLAPTTVVPSVSFSCQPAGPLLPFATSLTFSAQVSDADGTIAEVDFYSGSTLLASFAGPPYSFTWSNPPPAVMQNCYAVATDDQDSMESSAVIPITEVPPNDDFADRISLIGSNLVVRTSNLLATKEAGEPNHGGNVGGHSLWWSWTAPYDVSIVLDPSGSSISTVLAVYTGSTLTNFSLVASNGLAAGGPVIFHAAAGKTYQIAMDGWNGGVGSLSFTLRVYNDDFAQAVSLVGVSISVQGFNIAATKQSGEPNHAGNSGGHSLWWTWTPAQDGVVEISTTGSSINTALGVYTGSAVEALSLVASNGNWSYSLVSFKASAGRPYQIAIDGWGGAVGTVVLNLIESPPPQNDDFTNRTVLTSTNATGVNRFATKEAGEPNHAGNSGGHSMWWSWTAPQDMGLELNTKGSSFPGVIAAYLGSSLPTLSLVASNANSGVSGAYLRASSGLTYQIAVDGRDGATGNIVLNLIPAPANDDFSKRAVLTGTNISLRAANVGATLEPGEPAHVGNPGGHSLWWSWTAPATANVEINTVGSAIDTALAIYVGTSLSSLTAVASNGNYTASAVAFQAVGGTTYQIAVDGWSGEVGTLALNVLQLTPRANDNFANRQVITGTNASIASANDFATKEPGEPYHAGNVGGHSLWWTWTVPANGTAELNTLGSSIRTALAVYTGTALDALWRGESNAGGGNRVLFAVTAGDTYQIAVDGWDGAVGNVSLNLVLHLPPANDNFAQATPLAGTNASVQTSNLYASKELWEPNHAGNPGGHSLWWSWTPPQAGVARIDTSGSTINTALAVYTGAALNALSAVASNANYWSSAITIPASAGVTYHIAVDGWNGEAGNITLNLSEVASPINDYFTNRTIIVGTNFSFSGSNLYVTKEPGEPNHVGDPGGHSLWWSWVPPMDGVVQIDTFGSAINTALAVYTGSSINSLSVVASNGNYNASSVIFRVSASTAYQIALDGWSGAVGNVVLNLMESLPPANDDFVNRATLAGTNLTALGSNGFATKEPREPDHAGTTGGHSLWWSWTAPNTLPVQVDTIGSGFNTALAVYTGTSVSNLSLVSANANYANSQLIFGAHQGTIYQIALDGWSGAVGNFVLNLFERPPPANDDFAQATVLVGTNATGAGSNLFATKQPGEPNHAGDSGGHSLWWRWTPPSDMGAVLTTSGSTCDTALGVYTGSVVSALSLVASNSNYHASAVAFQAHAGTPYSIAVDGWNGEVGTVVLNLVEAALNDDFSNSTTIVGTNLATQVSNRLATKQPGEPDHVGNAGGHSVWWNWTAAADCFVSINTVGSGLDTALAVYAGSTLTNLSVVASNANWTESAVQFRAHGGVVYQIAVDGWSGEVGEVVLNFTVLPLPINDNFADRIALTGTNVSTTSWNYGASSESGEPNHAGNQAAASLWWSWTSPGTALAQINTEGSAIHTALAVYTGASIDTLAPVASDAGGLASGVQFNAVPGAVYQIALDGWAGAEGPLTLNLQAFLAPANDNFTNSIPLTGINLSIAASNYGATREAGEPTHARNPKDPSVWWNWTAPANAVVQIDTKGSEINTALGVYTGTAITNLTLVASNSNYSSSAVRFNAMQGTTYAIAVDGWNGAEGPIILNLVAQLAQGNDNFDQRSILFGSRATITGTNSLATYQSGEPLLGGASGFTLWWSWTAPADGRVSLSISNGFATGYAVPPGWSNGPAVGVYQGSVLTNLTLMASNTVYGCDFAPGCTWYGLPSTSFPVVSGQTYLLSMDGLNGAKGTASIDLSLGPPALRPDNDNFAAAMPLAGAFLNVTGTTLSATRELGEPSHGALTNAGSVWWSWNAADSGTVQLTVYPRLDLAVYAGNQLVRLVPVVKGNGSVSFYAHAGTSYEVAVEDSATWSGGFWLWLMGPPPPPVADAAGSSALSNGSFQLRVRGASGQGFLIQTSTNLVAWRNMGFESLNGSTFDFIDNDSWAYGQRFYRIISLDAVLDYVPLRILSTEVTTNGAVRVRIVGPAGEPFYLQASTDLQNWTDLTSGVLTDDEFDFTDNEAGQLPLRMYRVVPP